MRVIAGLRMVGVAVVLLGGGALSADEVARTPDAAATPQVTAARGVTPISSERTVEGVVVDIGLGGQRAQRTPGAAALAGGGGEGGQGRGRGKGRGDGGGRGGGDGSGGGGKGRGDGGGGKWRDAARTGGGGGMDGGGGGGGGRKRRAGGGRGDGSGGGKKARMADSGAAAGGAVDKTPGAGGAAIASGGGGGRRGGGGGDGRGDGSGGGAGARRAGQAGTEAAGARQGQRLRRGQLLLDVDGEQVLVDLGRATLKANPPIAIGDRLKVTGSEGRGGRKALRATRVERGGETFDIAPARVVTPGRIPGRQSATQPAPKPR